MALLAFFATMFFIGLGFWQLERAQEKKGMLKEQAKLAKLAPLRWEKADALPKQYQRLRVEGRYLRQTFFLDNQHYQHQFGYHVIKPLLLRTGNVLLIDRGWIAGELSRQHLPEVVIPENNRQVKGSVYYPSEKNWVLGQVLEKKEANKYIIERVDTKLISQLLHKSVYPFIIRLDNDGRSGLVREWPIVAMPPERHYAYAVQWFAIATVVLILFIALNLKKNDEDD